MKINFRFINIGLLALFLLGLGCREIHIETTFYPDGSMKRVLTKNYNSSGNVPSAIVFPQDDSWKVEQYSNDKGEKCHSFTKEFRTIELANQEYTSIRDTSLHLTSEFTFEKKFRWFYSYYRISEIVHELGPRTAVANSPYQHVFDQFIGQKTPNLEDDDEINLLLFEGLFHVLLQEANRIKDKDLDPAKMISQKDSLFKILDEQIHDFDNPIPDFLKHCSQIFQTKSVWNAQPALQEFCQLLDNYDKFIQQTFDESYHISLIVPGKIFDTNAISFEKNKAMWEVNMEAVMFSNFEMWIESRCLNLVPTIFSAVIILACLIGLLLTLPKKNNHKVTNTL